LTLKVKWNFFPKFFLSKWPSYGYKMAALAKRSLDCAAKPSKWRQKFNYKVRALIFLG